MYHLLSGGVYDLAGILCTYQNALRSFVLAGIMCLYRDTFSVCCLIEQHVYVSCCLASIMCIHRVALRWFLCKNQWDKKMRKHLLIDCISSNFQPLICNLYATNYFMCMLIVCLC